MVDNGNLTRIINNLYTRVFEHGKLTRNAIFRNTISPLERLTFSETEIGIYNNIPDARYYADLAISGTYVQATGIVTPVTISGPGAVCDETAFWLVFKVAPKWAHASSPNTLPTLFRWQNDANNKLWVGYNQATDAWMAKRLNAGSGATVSITGTHVADETVFLIAKFTATTIQLSLNGAAFVSVGNTNIPTITAADFNIGQGDGYSNTVFKYIIAGIGTLSDSDAAYWYSTFVGDAPVWDDIPSFVAADASFLWTAANAVHLETARYGEGFYA